METWRFGKDGNPAHEGLTERQRMIPVERVTQVDEIFLGGMQFFGRHGVMPEETALGQRFVVDLRICLDLRRAGETDQVEDTVDYAAVYDLVRNRVEGPPVRLLERLVEQIAGDVLMYSVRVNQVEVTVHKPGAPIPGVFGTAGVRIVRNRESTPRLS